MREGRRDRASSGGLGWAVREELLWDPDLAMADVRVNVVNGIVTLSGRVESPAKRVAVETAAKRVMGVRDVQNEVVVVLTSRHSQRDAGKPGRSAGYAG